MVKDFNIAIRVKSSMGHGEPLYVIDGVVCDNMNFLNPADIEKSTSWKMPPLPLSMDHAQQTALWWLATEASRNEHKDEAKVRYFTTDITVTKP